MSLTPVIASPCSPAYFRVMFSAVLRLLTVAALVVMPFGMSAASIGSAQHASVANKGHCDDQSGKPAEEPVDRLAGCTAGCSMFMAEIAPAEAPIAVLGEAVAGPILQPWLSLPPETATPPPKIA